MSDTENHERETLGVLLVEGNRDVLDCLATILFNRRFDVRSTSDRDGIGRILSNDKPFITDLAIVNLNSGNREDATNAMREIKSSWPRAKIVVITSRVNFGSVEFSRAAGADMIIQNPFLPFDELFSTISELVGQEQKPEQRLAP